MIDQKIEYYFAFRIDNTNNIKRLLLIKNIASLRFYIFVANLLLIYCISYALIPKEYNVFDQIRMPLMLYFSSSLHVICVNINKNQRSNKNFSHFLNVFGISYKMQTVFWRSCVNLLHLL